MRSNTIGRPMEILLVEDDLLQARLCVEALRSGEVQHRLSLVCDGQESLDFLYRRGVFSRTPTPDIILLDLRLPKVDGIEVLEEIKGNEELRQIPVVIMTSSDDEQDRLSCQMLNAEAYITKPVDLKKFLALVTELKRYWHEDMILPGV